MRGELDPISVITTSIVSFLFALFWAIDDIVQAIEKGNKK